MPTDHTQTPPPAARRGLGCLTVRPAARPSAGHPGRRRALT